jgi:regulator of sigma D
MAEEESTAPNRPRSRKLIEDMLRERQQVLVLLWELSKLDLSAPDESLRETLEEFQEILVDYIAAAHFGLYQRIAEGNERRQAVLATAREIYGRIVRTTDIAVEFSEKYDAPDDETIANRLAADLSLLAEELTSRIELEDRLILAMVGQDFPIPRAAATPLPRA